MCHLFVRKRCHRPVTFSPTCLQDLVVVVFWLVADYTPESPGQLHTRNGCGMREETDEEKENERMERKTAVDWAIQFQ